MSSILEALSSLVDQDQDQEPYMVESRHYTIARDKYIPRDYRPVMLAGRAPREGSRALCYGGGQVNTVVHAQSDRTQNLGRMHRNQGDLLCGQKQGRRSFDRYAKDGQPVTCPRCLAITEKYGLSTGLLIQVVR